MLAATRNRTPRKVLLVDDDEALRDSLSEQLCLYEDMETVAAADGAGALAATRNECHYDAILLDVGLPDMDGREVCRLMRRNGVKSPILMLTGQDTDADQILGLDAGANDYIVKPFRLNVLLARLRAQLRQHEQSEDAAFVVGPYRFEPGSRLLTTAAGRKIRLTEGETRLLRYLCRAGDRAVTRETLLSEVCNFNAGAETHTLETRVYRVRQKIEANPSAPQILVTEANGYRLVR